MSFKKYADVDVLCKVDFFLNTGRANLKILG